MSDVIAPPMTLEEEFLELVLADDCLVRAEFDEIIAAEGLDLPEPPRQQPPDRPGDSSPDAVTKPIDDGDGGRRLSTPRGARFDAWSVGRERSPPH